MIKAPRISGYARNTSPLTKVQYQTLLKFECSSYGDLHFSGRSLRTAWALKEKGLIAQGYGGWYSILARGYDILRLTRRQYLLKSQHGAKTPSTLGDGTVIEEQS